MFYGNLYGMKNKENYSEEIINITKNIEQKHLELSKFFNEKPENIPFSIIPKVNLRMLNDYYKSLESLLNRHVEIKKLAH
jgi:hypothetical protein